MHTKIEVKVPCYSCYISTWHGRWLPCAAKTIEHRRRECAVLRALALVAFSFCARLELSGGYTVFTAAGAREQKRQKHLDLYLA